MTNYLKRLSHFRFCSLSLFTFTLKQRFRLNVVLITATTVALVGCNTLDDWFSTDKVNYRSAAAGPALVVPPDLTAPSFSQKFTVPDYSHSVGINADPVVVNSNAGAQADVPQVMRKLHIERERDNNRYWLVINGVNGDNGDLSEQLWPQLQAFWERNGFTLTTNQPEIGIMETDWAENRAKIPDDWFRRTLSKVFNGLYSSGMRDKFRTLVERGPDHTMVISITHYGIEEILIGRDKDSSRWQDRGRDPHLEIAFLKRLIETFGLTTEQTQQLIANACVIER